MVRAVLTGWSTGSGFDLTWFNCLSSQYLCVFGIHGDILKLFLLLLLLYFLVSWAWWDWPLT